MSSASDDGPGPTRQAAENVDLEARKRALETGLAGARRRNAPPADTAGRGSALGMAFRIATEMLAGLIVGGLIGWQLDAWLGTRPALFLVFIALGAAAGMRNVIRYAYRMNRIGQGLDGEADGRDDTGRREGR